MAEDAELEEVEVTARRESGGILTRIKQLPEVFAAGLAALAVPAPDKPKPPPPKPRPTLTLVPKPTTPPPPIGDVIVRAVRPAPPSLVALGPAGLAVLTVGGLVEVFRRSSEKAMDRWIEILDEAKPEPEPTVETQPEKPPAMPVPDVVLPDVVISAPRPSTPGLTFPSPFFPIQQPIGQPGIRRETAPEPQPMVPPVELPVPEPVPVPVPVPALPPTPRPPLEPPQEPRRPPQRRRDWRPRLRPEVLPRPQPVPIRQPVTRPPTRPPPRSPIVTPTRIGSPLPSPVRISNPLRLPSALSDQLDDVLTFITPKPKLEREPETARCKPCPDNKPKPRAKCFAGHYRELQDGTDLKKKWREIKCQSSKGPPVLRPVPVSTSSRGRRSNSRARGR